MARKMALRDPDWDVCSQVCKGAESWCVGIGEQAQSEKCCWLWEDALRGREGGNPQQGMPMEEDWLPWKQGTIAKFHAGIGDTIVTSLSPHVTACQ